MAKKLGLALKLGQTLLEGNGIDGVIRRLEPAGQVIRQMVKSLAALKEGKDE